MRVDAPGHGCFLLPFGGGAAFDEKAVQTAIFGNRKRIGG